MNKVRMSVAFVLVLLLSLGLIGCGKVQPKTDAAHPVISLQDDYGRTVRLKRVPQRIVSLSPAHTEILFALGLGSKVVGVTDYCDYPAEAKKKEKVGGYMDPNLEKIIALRPDLVVADSLNQEAVEGLEKANIQVVALNPRDIKAVLATINKIGRATGTEDKARVLVAKIKNDMQKVIEKTKLLSPDAKPRVYYEVWNEPLITAGHGTVIDDLINLAGGVNIAGDTAKEYPEYSMEVLIKKNPEIMIHSYGHGSEASGEDQIYNRQGWDNISCIRNQKVYCVDANLAARPGPRIGEALNEFARAIHPELFAGNQEGKK